MKRLLLAVALLAPAVPGFAMAGGLLYDGSASWSGFYVGLEGGYGWGNTSSDAYTTAGDFVDHTSFSREGGFGGLQAGYSIMVAPTWLLGIEGDVSVGAINGTLDVCVADRGCTHTNSSVNMISTLRGRAGYTFNNMLIYGTGGLALVESDNTRTIVSSVVPALAGQSTVSDALSAGWAAGGGIEWAITPRLSGKVEYLFIGYNSTHDYSYTVSSGNRHVTGENQLDLVRAGLSYHLGGLPEPLPLK